MSEIATEINQTGETITTIEFLGQSFQERKEALHKIDAFREEAGQALVDSVELIVGETALVTFRPSAVKYREWRLTVPCYSIFDKEKTPYERQVTIQSVDSETNTVLLGEGDYSDGSFNQTWSVKLSRILDIMPPEQDSTQTNE